MQEKEGLPGGPDNDLLDSAGWHEHLLAIQIATHHESVAWKSYTSGWQSSAVTAAQEAAPDSSAVEFYQEEGTTVLIENYYFC